MRIQHNILSMNAYRNYNNNTSALGRNLEKLSSGYKINRAGDDAAGLAISEKMRAQIKGLDAAQKNVKDSISFVKTAEGAMQEIQDMLSRMKYLATQSANGTYQDKVDREALQDEVNSLLDEIDRIAQSANFNDVHMLNGPEEKGDDATSALEASLDTTNAAKLGDVTVAFADDATEEQKAALNKALAGDFKFTTTDEGDGAWGAGDKINIDKLPTGYTAKIKAQDGTTDISITAGTDLETGTGNDKIDATKDLAIDLYDAQNKKVATITVGKPTAGATGNTTVTFKEAAPAAAPAAAAGADAAKKYSSKVTGDDGTNKLADNDTIKIGSKTYTLKAGGTGTDEIDSTANDTFAKQIKAAVDAYNAEAGEDFTAEYKDGVMTFTVKDGKNPTAAPTFTITDAGGKFSAGTVEEVKDAGDTTTGGKTGNFTIKFQIGDTSDGYNQLNISIKSMSVASLALTGLDISTDKAASTSIQQIKDAINEVSSVRGELGAWQNRLEHTANNLSVMHENIQDAESTIRDTDVADEMMAYTKNNILIQSAQAMLAQANAVPQGVLQLLQ